MVVWLLATALWEQQVLSTWRETATPNKAELAVLDECGSVYPPRADGYATQYAGSWGNWEINEERQHPNCAPLVGKTGFFSFVAMQAPERAALRQRSQDAIEAATRTASVTGAAFPAGLLVIVLILQWATRRSRPV